MTALKKKEKAGIASSMGLDDLGDLSSLLSTPDVVQAGTGPKEFLIDLIDEDPDQPRSEESPGFSKESLLELAETIRNRGVKSPISLRDNPEAPGRFLINHGARRFRASKLAGKTTIPGFLDNDYLRVDQVIENLQRNDLTAREIADWIGRELAAGKKKGEIASDLGKSASFVSQHATLLDLPEEIAQPFNDGRIRDVTVVNELVTAFKKNPFEVNNWLADCGAEITRSDVKVFREFLQEKEKQQATPEQNSEPIVIKKNKVHPEEKPAAALKQQNPEKKAAKPMAVIVLFEGSEGVLVLDRQPEQGKVFVRVGEDEPIQVDLESVVLVEVRPE